MAVQKLIIRLSSYNSSENIRKKEGNTKLSSLNRNELAMKTRERYCNLKVGGFSS